MSSSKIFSLVKLSLLGILSVFFVAGASAQTAPNYALKLTSTHSTPSGPETTTTWYYSDDGIFNFSSNLSHQGLNTEQFFTVNDTLAFAVYVRSQPDFFPNGGPVLRQRAVTGTVSATKPFGDNFSARATAPNSYPSLGSGCINYNGPTHWTACARFEAPKTETNEVFYSDSATNNAGFPFTNAVPDYPLVPYRLVPSTTSLVSEITFFCDPRYGIHTCTIPAVGGTNSLTGKLAVSISSPTYSKQPGSNPGHEEHFTCGAQAPSSSADSAPGASSFGFDEEGTPPMSIALNASTGNSMITVEDPIRTRGHPLANRIYLNTQVVESQRPMGNATFTYDIHVFSPAMSGQSRWLVVDGDGKRLDYGTGATPLGAPGNYAVLTETPTGFLLSNAGTPENLRSTGNYSYAFDTDGKLLSITDPAGNVQTLTYTSGQLTEVLDVSSEKHLSFAWTGSRITAITENGGAQTLLTYTAGTQQLATIALQDSTFGVARTAQFTYNSGGLLETVTRDSDPTNTYTFSYLTITPNVPLARIFGEGRSVQPFYASYVPSGV
ncbi:MAG: hypothetical protein J0M12_00005, partial [Deltaproteobacteria bacterium]|nr:hypothetical protein [Deltaproteobacteria bacterium]